MGLCHSDLHDGHARWDRNLVRRRRGVRLRPAGRTRASGPSNGRLADAASPPDVRSGSTPTLDPARTNALIGILLVALASWLAVPVVLWETGPDVDFGFTTNNVAYVFGRVALPATLVLAAGGATLGLRGLHHAAMVVTCAHILLQLVIGAVQLILGARLPLTVGTTMEIFVLGLALAGLVVARSAPLRGPTTQRWVALSLVTAAAVLTILPELFEFALQGEVRYLPFLLPGLALTIVVVLAAGLLGFPQQWARFTAAGLLIVYSAWSLLILPWGRELDANLIPWIVGTSVETMLAVAAAVLAFAAARRSSRI